MVIIAIPLLNQLWGKELGWQVESSALFVLATSAAILVFRKRLFTLPRDALWFVAFVHFLRIVAVTVLAGVMWHLLLPSVSLSMWILLGTMRQLISRLPLIPNKDIVFAGLAAFMIGHDSQIASAMALMATLILAAHLIVGMALGASGILRGSKA